MSDLVEDLKKMGFLLPHHILYGLLGQDDFCGSLFGSMVTYKWLVEHQTPDQEFVCLGKTQ